MSALCHKRTHPLQQKVAIRSPYWRGVALLQTFARQAAIAVENVRLFDETKEAPGLIGIN
jgi:hypothetical protein